MMKKTQIKQNRILFVPPETKFAMRQKEVWGIYLYFLHLVLTLVTFGFCLAQTNAAFNFPFFHNIVDLSTLVVFPPTQRVEVVYEWDFLGVVLNVQLF